LVGRRWANSTTFLIEACVETENAFLVGRRWANSTSFLIEACVETHNAFLVGRRWANSTTFLIEACVETVNAFLVGRRWANSTSFQIEAFKSFHALYQCTNHTIKFCWIWREKEKIIQCFNSQTRTDKYEIIHAHDISQSHLENDA